MKEWNLLLVDDEEEFVSTLAERLTMRGLRVRAALDGESALRMINEDPPNVVLLDVLMPGMGGLEVLRVIKKLHPETQVILLTGHGSTRDGMEGMRHGAFDYLTKPLKIEDLMAKLEEAVAGKGPK
jgi:DNA-binding NtrC family response regulator